MMGICITRHFEAQFIRKLSNAEAELKKSVAFKNKVHFIATYNDSAVNLKLLLLESWKNQFFRPDFVDSEIVIWGLTSLTDFYKGAHLLLKKRHVSDCQKKISLVQITHL